MGAFAATGVLTACGGSATPLAHTHAAPDALGAAVIEAIGHRDADRLRALAVDEREFRAHVWPELPAARPERNLPFSYVWGDLHQKSEAALRSALARHGGRRYSLVKTRFDGVRTDYPSFRVYRDTLLTVRDETGALHDIRFFGASLEKDGAWKVFSYVTDD